MKAGSLFMRGATLHVCIATLGNRIIAVPVKQRPRSIHRADVLLPRDAFPASIPVGIAPRAIAAAPVTVRTEKTGPALGQLAVPALLTIQRAALDEAATQRAEDDGTRNTEWQSRSAKQNAPHWRQATETQP